MPYYKDESAVIFRNALKDPLSALDRALAFQDPNSFEYKNLMDMYQVDADKNELSLQLMIHLADANLAEEKLVERKQELESQREEEKEKREAAIARNEEIDAEQRVAAKSVVELHSEITERVQEIKKLDEKLYQYEQEKVEIDQKISEKDKEITVLEKDWNKGLEKAADKFVDDNFKLSPDGKYVSAKHPEIKLLEGAIDIIKKAFTDAKSPAEMTKHNPRLIENPERMMQVDDVRKELSIAKKVDKIVAPEALKEFAGKRKLFRKEPVLDEAGKRVYGADGKPLTRLVEMDPKKYDLEKGTVESSNKNKNYVVCLNGVCMLKEMVVKPIDHDPAQTALGTNLLKQGAELNQLQESRQQCIHNIEDTKAEIVAEKKGVDRAYKEVTALHPDITHDQVLINAEKKSEEKAPLQTVDPVQPDRTEDQVSLNADKKSVEESPPSENNTPRM